jgi:hypothetical protein
MAKSQSERADQLIEAIGRRVIAERAIAHVVRLQESAEVMRAQGYPDTDREEVLSIAREKVSAAIDEARRDIDYLLGPQ